MSSRLATTFRTRLTKPPFNASVEGRAAQVCSVGLCVLSLKQWRNQCITCGTGPHGPII